MNSLGPLSLAALSTTVALALRELNLGQRCWLQTAAYTDLVQGSFCLHDPSPTDRITIERHFTILVRRYNWNPPATTIIKQKNLITLTLTREKSRTKFQPEWLFDGNFKH